MTENSPHQKDAILFIQGAGSEKLNQHIDVIARRFRDALERQTQPAEIQFKIIGAPEEKYGEIYRTPIRTITHSVGGKGAPQPVADIYVLDYRDTLTKRFDGYNPLIKILVMFSTMAALFPRVICSLGKDAKDLRDKLQLITMGGIMLALVAYTGILMSALVMTITQLPELQTEVPQWIDSTYKNFITPISRDESKKSNGTEALQRSKEEKKQKGAKLGLLQSMVVILTGLGLFKRKSLKEEISNIATVFVCAGNYLRLADCKPEVVGQATALLEHIAEKKEKYRSVHIVAYSFGSLVALDVVFPHSRPGARLDTISTLVTIGCPFDLVRMYWPEYFTQRRVHEHACPKWINVYAPLDVYGSNFRDDMHIGEAEKGIDVISDTAAVFKPAVNISYVVGMQTGQLNAFDVLTIKGVKIHNLYWSDGEAPEISCFDDITAELQNRGMS